MTLLPRSRPLTLVVTPAPSRRHQLVVEAWRLTAPKRLVREYDETTAAER